MHSSRMRAVCLLTTSCSIPCVSGGSTQLLRVGRPVGSAHLPADPQDADSLQADPPQDEDRTGCRPPGHVTCDACWEANPTPL